MGIPEYEAKRYEGRVKHGGILLSVHCDSHDWVKRAEGIFKRTGAEDIASAGEAAADFAISDKPMARTRTPIMDKERGLNDTDEMEDELSERPRTRTTGGGSNFDV
jgi:hypothetical protein